MARSPGALIIFPSDAMRSRRSGVPLPSIDLHAVDELLEFRAFVNLGSPGAPPKYDGQRVGAALHNSCILMLSALLQGYVEDAFLDCARRCLRTLTNPEIARACQSTISRWGNPKPDNIERLCLRIGMTDLLSGLSWQGCSTKQVKRKLEDLNKLRNQIAHRGYPDRPISLATVRNYRDFVERFAVRLAERVSAMCP